MCALVLLALAQGGVTQEPFYYDARLERQGRPGKLYNATALLKVSSAELVWQDFANIHGAQIWWSRNPSAGSSQGIHMMPKSQKDLPWDAAFGASRMPNRETTGEIPGLGFASASGEPRVGEGATIDPDDPTRTWISQRVGPMSSIGGYDWWNLYWSDFMGLGKAVSSEPEGVDVDAFVSVAVDQSDNILSHPPIHIHHVHISAQQDELMGLSPYLSLPKLLSLDVSASVDSLLQHHGDLECLPEDGGVDCMGLQFPEAPIRLRPKLRAPVTAQLNDVRPSGSPAMAWYYHIACRYRLSKLTGTVDGVRSLHVIQQVISINQPLLTFSISGVHESMMYIATRPPPTMVGAKLLTARTHTHAGCSQEMMLFDVEPSALGLGIEPFVVNIDGVNVPLDPRSVGLATNVELRDSLLRNVGGGPPVCHALFNAVNDTTYHPAGYLADRLATIFCLPNYVFGAKVYTSVIFTGPTRYTHDTCAADPWPIHGVWYVEYASPFWASYNTVAITSQNPDRSVTQDRLQAFWEVFLKVHGIPNDGNILSNPVLFGLILAMTAVGVLYTKIVPLLVVFVTVLVLSKRVKLSRWRGVQLAFAAAGSVLWFWALYQLAMKAHVPTLNMAGMHEAVREGQGPIPELAGGLVPLVLVVLSVIDARIIMRARREMREAKQNETKQYGMGVVKDGSSMARTAEEAAPVFRA